MTLEDLNKYITTLAAFVGVGLGLYNLYVSNANRKVSLKVIPKAILKRGVISASGKESEITSTNEFSQLWDEFAIEVINMSSFAVTVDNVGFKLRRNKGNLFIHPPLIKDGGEWPRVLQPRQAVTVYVNLNHLYKSIGNRLIKNAFAETACRSTCVGSTSALKELTNHLRKQIKIS